MLARGDGDLVSLARPFLADAAWAAKARDGQSEQINTCIALKEKQGPAVAAWLNAR